MRRKSKSQRYFILYIVLFLMILTSPFWIWQLLPEHKLNVLIIDKTVTRQSFREHQGLTWVLNNQKYVKDNGGAYSVSKDFLENVPNVQKEQNQFDVIYLADQYGVHGNEGGPQNKEENPGGLTVEEIDVLENRLHSNSTLIAEFNTFASPTKQDARERISNILNVTWTGWTGRYFSNLASDEIPDWLKKRYQDQYNKKWTVQFERFRVYS